jgi:hypothetical protein
MVYLPQGNRFESMIQVNIHEAKTKPSQLLARVEAGEEAIIARAAIPLLGPRVSSSHVGHAY